ncbi:MAG: SIMPL domain-containing protein [Desulfobacterales bacterium]
MKRKAFFVLMITLLCVRPGADARAEAYADTEYTAAEPATLTVLGHGDISVAPDRAVLRLGAVAQAAKAAEAQDQVNRIVHDSIKKIKLLGVEDKNIATVDLSIYPVYENQPPEHRDQASPPAVRGYRAGNIIEVQIEKLDRLGDVIDAGLAAGANRIEGLTFGLKDDANSRKQALQLAVAEAEAKADAIARAMGVDIIGIKQISEGGVTLVRPQMDSGAVFSARAAATPVQAGQVRIEASVTVSYYIAEAEADSPDTGSVSMGPVRITLAIVHP